MLDVVQDGPGRVATIDVEDISEAIFEDPTDGIVIGEIVVLLEVSVFVEAYCCVVGGEDVQVDGFAVVLGSSGYVIL